MTDITVEVQEDTICCFRVGDEVKMLDPRRYSSGAAMKKEVLAWAKPKGGTNPVGF